ncbi:MAG TPA: VWA domain-containing protein, partial [Candidatus Nanoarchaeia archaeon]|nr:VWA domain-containing protein [Candidatus Nanoarchaeia archaeon]
IKNSLVLPFRFLAASDEIKKMTSNASVRKVLAAISKALDISAENVPVFEGETLVVLDVSGSMTHNANTLGNKSPHIIGGLFAAMIAKKNNSDFMTFDGSARYISYNPLDTITSIVSRISFNGGSTDFHTIFKTANKKYDRVIILSDMQGWVQARAANGPFAEYKRKFNVTPYLYSFDLQNYGSMQFPENNVFCVAGFSDKIFDIMQLLEQDKKALINEIKKVKL